MPVVFENLAKIKKKNPLKIDLIRVKVSILEPFLNVIFVIFLKRNLIFMNLICNYAHSFMIMAYIQHAFKISG